MNTVFEINWRVADIIREKLSFENWHKTVFDFPASKKVLNKIKNTERELKQMKKDVLLAAKDEAAA